MINIDNELKNVKKLKDAIIEESEKQTEPRRWYYGILINESLFEHYKTLDKMQDMLVRNRDSIDEELYNKYKKTLPKSMEDEVEEINTPDEEVEETSAPLDFKNELAQVQDRKTIIINDSTYNVKEGEIRLSYAGIIVKKEYFEEFKALLQMEDMLKNSRDNFNLALYQKYKEITALGPKKQESALATSNLNLEAIQKRLAQIRHEKQTATGNREIVIAGGDPVLKEHAQEYAALKKREQELKNQPLNVTGQQPKSEQKDPEMSVEALINEEKEAIKAKLSKYEDLSERGEPIFNPTVIAENGKRVLKTDIGDYDKLNDLLEIIESEFTTEDAKDYNEKRSITSLGRMDEDKFNKIYNYYKNKNFAQTIQNPNSAPVPNQLPNPEPEIDPEPPQNLDDEELIEVIKMSKWDWVKTHKKGILITLGVTAITATFVILMNQLIPAVAAASKAAQVANIASQMLANGHAWGTASVTAQKILHGGNVVLAQAASTITGIPNAFNAATGAWTFGTQTLAQFATSAAANVGPAIAKVASISKIAAGTTISGLGLAAVGRLLPKNKSASYKEINKEIKAFRKKSTDLEVEEIDLEAEKLRALINSAEKLTAQEKEILQKRLNKYQKQAIKFYVNKESIYSPFQDNLSLSRSM